MGFAQDLEAKIDELGVEVAVVKAKVSSVDATVEEMFEVIKNSAVPADVQAALLAKLEVVKGAVVETVAAVDKIASDD